MRRFHDLKFRFRFHYLLVRRKYANYYKYLKINEHSREDINNADVDGEEKVDEM